MPTRVVFFPFPWGEFNRIEGRGKKEEGVAIT
jgi:hypothetical protein